MVIASVANVIAQQHKVPLPRMYIDSITLENFRTFRQSKTTFLHSEKTHSKAVSYPNINVVLGNNGLGKTTLLKAISLACLGPAVADSGIYPYRLVRTKSKKENDVTDPTMALVDACFCIHPQDKVNNYEGLLSSVLQIVKRQDLESFRTQITDEKPWDAIYSSQNDAFFFVGYGATRTVEKSDKIDFGSRNQSSFLRARRIKSLFEETYSLVPFNAWLPQLQSMDPERFEQILELVNQLLGKEHFLFEGEMEDGEYLFNRKGLKIPFPALSDGYRAFLGWIGDLLYHVSLSSPSGKSLLSNCGIVLIDEIDLHLHPSWQMTILPKLSKALPNIQFIVTTHSPLVVGSIEQENIIAIVPDTFQASKLKRFNQPTKGLDADQILLTDYFGLTSTVSDDKAKLLKDLTLQASQGDVKAATALLATLSGKGSVDHDPL